MTSMTEPNSTLYLRVLSRQGVAVSGPAASFGPQGGTIGRAAGNALVLDDPERTVSRVHAQIVCRDGVWAVIDRGSNAMLCNDLPLGAGNEAPLSAGDRLHIGDFEVGVELRAAVPALEPAAPAAASRASDAAALADDPFADLLAGLVPSTPQPAPEAPAPAALADPSASAASASDPFADLFASASADADPLGSLAEFAEPAAQGIDFLLGPGAAAPGVDPLAQSPLADPLHGAGAATTDPLVALGLNAPPAPPAPPPIQDHLSVDQFGFVPPRVESAAPAPSAAPPSAALPFAARPDSEGYETELIAALMRGLHGMQPPVEALTPGLMERIGALLRTATEGTLQLLQARQELKREVRAQVTMIAAQANNPLKFSPTVEMALAHLLTPGVRGFMPAEAAMRDAYDDLRAHQFGIMAGMRAVLAQLFQRFSPEALEKKIAARTALDSLFSAGRKARLWNEFTVLYADLAREAENDFHTLFAQAFTAAYEAQMAQLKPRP